MFSNIVEATRGEKMWNVEVCRISGGQRHHTSDGWLLARAGWNANIYPILRILVASTSTLYISTYISTWAQAAHSSHNTALCLGSGVSGDFYTLVMANWNELRPSWAQAVQYLAPWNCPTFVDRFPQNLQWAEMMLDPHLIYFLKYNGKLHVSCFMDLNCLKQCLNLKNLNCWAARAGDDATWRGVQDTEREHS